MTDYEDIYNIISNYFDPRICSGVTECTNEIIDLLNNYIEKNEQLKKEIKRLNLESDTFDKLYSAELDIIKKLRKEKEQFKTKNNAYLQDLEVLKEHNTQLQTRNDRQANSLDEVYNLIENEDWEALKQIIQDFKECDEQLRKEWKCYE